MNDLFDFAASQRARDEAMARAEAAASEAWKTDAHNAIVWLAVKQATFTTDDVWRRLMNLEVPPPDERRALGALMRSARCKGLIKPLDQWVRSVRVACHRRPLQVWESQVFGRDS